MLSTLSVDVPGYPFGSVVPYCLDGQGLPILLISRIAQHTKNILADSRVSLTVTEGEVEDVQTGGRLTFLGNARLADAQEEAGERYYRYFPQSRDYHKTHDFDFYRIEPVRARWIGGFGDINWLQPGQLVLPNPFDSAQELSMVEHMNADHVEAMRRYCELAGITLNNGTIPQLAGIDGEGFHLRLNARLVYFQFESPVATPMEVREALVKMAGR